MNQKPISGRENRKFKRIPTDRPIKIVHNDQQYNLKMLNLSEGGVGVLSPIKFENNEELIIYLTLPFMNQLTEMKIKATLMYSSPIREKFRLGFRFENLTRHQKMVLQKFVNHEFYFRL